MNAMQKILAAIGLRCVAGRLTKDGLSDSEARIVMADHYDAFVEWMFDKPRFSMGQRYYFWSDVEEWVLTLDRVPTPMHDRRDEVEQTPSSKWEVWIPVRTPPRILTRDED